MAIIVQKYGGTSMGSLSRINNVAQRVITSKQQLVAEDRLIVVVSAMAGVTDKLLNMVDQVTKQPCAREIDRLLSTGENQSVALLAMTLQSMGVKAISVTGEQAGIKVKGNHSKGRIDHIDQQYIMDLFTDYEVVVCAGFQGQGLNNNEVYTLGRGGSDLSAIAIAAAVKAEKCQIFTDVDGVYTCDPRIVKNARKISHISYEEMLEMASSGSKVMQSRSVELAQKYGVVFEVRSSLNFLAGTTVEQENKNMEDVVIRGVSVEKSQARITISEIDDKPGSSAVIMQQLAKADINIDMIVANISSDGKARQSFTMHENDLGKAHKALKAVYPNMKQIETETGLAKLSCVGIGMRSHSGVAAKMFQVLGNNGINIKMVATSEIKIAVAIEESDVELAANVVHNAFIEQ